MWQPWQQCSFLAPSNVKFLGWVRYERLLHTFFFFNSSELRSHLSSKEACPRVYREKRAMKGTLLTRGVLPISGSMALTHQHSLLWTGTLDLTVTCQCELRQLSAVSTSIAAFPLPLHPTMVRQGKIHTEWGAAFLRLWHAAKYSPLDVSATEKSRVSLLLNMTIPASFNVKVRIFQTAECPTAG